MVLCCHQVDVLETQFSQLLERVSGTHDYETIKHAHEKYLITLQSQLFLTQPSVRLLYLHYCLGNSGSNHFVLFEG